MLKINTRKSKLKNVFFSFEYIVWITNIHKEQNVQSENVFFSSLGLGVIAEKPP